MIRSGKRLTFIGMTALWGTLANATPTCPVNAPQSLIYGYAIVGDIHIPNPGATPNYITCSGTHYFQTLEQAESILKNDPTQPGHAAAALAFPYNLGDLSASLTSQQPFTLDYRPSGTIGASTMYLPPAATYQKGYAIISSSWPPVGSQVASQCQTYENACNIGNFCPTAQAEQNRVVCQINATWKTPPYDCTVSGSSIVGSLLTQPTGIADLQTLDSSGRALGNYFTNPDGQALDVSLICSDSASTASSTSVKSPPPQTSYSSTSTTTSTMTQDWNMQTKQTFACPNGYSVNTSAVSNGGVPGYTCQAGFFKIFIHPPTQEQTDQCHVGDPCYPGSGNATVDEQGIHYGNIGYSLHYNSLRQLRTYAFIDQNWSASFSQRILTSDLTNSHDSANGPIYVQNDRGHLEQFNSIAPNTFESTNHVGDLLRTTYDNNTPPNVTGYMLTYAGGDTHVFDVAGRIISIVHPEDPRKTLTVAYSGITDITSPLYWQIASVTDGTGRSIKFQYDTTPPLYRLLNVSGDDAKVLLSLSYDGQNRLRSTTQPNANNKLRLIRTYHYDEAANILNNDLPFQLTSLSDENHLLDSTRFLSMQYDSWGRVTANWHGSSGAEKVTLSYAETFNPANPSAETSYVYVTTPLGDQLTYDYTSGQPYRKPDTIASASAGQEQLNYDPTSHRVNSKVDRNNVTTSYEYKDGIHQTAMTEAVGSPQQRRTETDWNSAINRIVARRIYNASGSNGGIETQDASAYNARGQVSAHCEIDPAINGASAYSCGSQINAPAGVRQWSYTYCEQSDVTAGTCPLVGLLLSTDGPRTDVSDVTGYVYYLSDDPACASTPAACSHRKGDLWKVTNARDQVTTYVSYDPSGRATRMQDANGVYTDITYHPRGWLLTRTVRANADGTPNSTLDATTSFGYDNVGNVTSVVQPDGTAMEYGYDDANRLTDIYDSPSITNTANSDHIKYTLDAAGNRKVESTYDPTGALKRALTRQYDQLNQLVAVLNGSTPSVAVQQFENPPPPETLPPGATDGYDGNGNAFYSVDTNGVGTEQQYDPLNRLVKTLQDHAGTGATHDTTTQYAYDARDNLRSVTDPDNLVTSHTYDGLNNLTQLTSPDTGTTTYGTATQPGYDAAGNRLMQTDANGITTTYSYDELNRLTSITYPTTSLNVTYAYDVQTTGCFNIGRLTQITDSSGSTTYCYDPRGNVLTKTQVTGGTTLTTGYTYTLADRIASITYPSGAIVSYGRDSAGRVLSIKYKANATATAQTILSNVSYYPFGPASVFTFGNGRTLTKIYDQNYAINTVASSDPNGLAITAGVDPLGNLTHASNGANPPSQTYGYDNLYRLTGVTDSSNNTVEAYTYGLTGDRLSKTYQGATSTYTYTSSLSTHQLQSDGVNQYGYDSDGNTLSIGQASKFSLSPTTNLTFDDRNRMSEADYGNSSCYACSTTSATYDYNGRGERVTKSVTVGNVQFNNFVTTTTDYVYNESGQLLGEYPGTSGVQTADYIYLDATPVAYVTNGTVYYIETDQLGTPRTVVKPGTPDTIDWKWDYFASAFGENAPNQDPSNTGTSFTFNLRFPGQYFDAETGLNYNYFRDYEPGTGRYVESDPIGLKKSTNTYSYVDSMPLYFVDPLGLCSCIANPNGHYGKHTGERNWLLQHVWTVVCDYYCTSNSGKSSVVTGSREVSFWLEGGYELSCYGVRYKYNPVAFTYFIDKPHSFDPASSDVPELIDWAKENCKDCKQ